MPDLATATHISYGGTAATEVWLGSTKVWPVIQWVSDGSIYASLYPYYDSSTQASLGLFFNLDWTAMANRYQGFRYYDGNAWVNKTPDILTLYNNTYAGVNASVFTPLFKSLGINRGLSENNKIRLFAFTVSGLSNGTYNGSVNCFIWETDPDFLSDWDLKQTFTIPNFNDVSAIDIDDTGDVFAVSLRQNEPGTSRSRNYCVQIFRHNNNSDIWELSETLSDNLPTASSTTFGSSYIRLSSDGTRIAISNPAATEDGVVTGKRYIYEYDGFFWNQVFSQNGLGWSAFSKNGKKLYVGLDREASFVWEDMDDGTWQRYQLPAALNTDSGFLIPSVNDDGSVFAFTNYYYKSSSLYRLGVDYSATQIATINHSDTSYQSFSPTFNPAGDKFAVTSRYRRTYTSSDGYIYYFPKVSLYKQNV